MFEKEQKDIFGFYDPHLDMNTYKGKILTAYMGVSTMDVPRAVKRITRRNMIKYYRKNQEELQDLEPQQFPEIPTQH